MMRRQMKLAAVLVVVVLALTGFSTSTSGGKGGKSKSGSSSGGGCSSSKKSNNGYRDNDFDDDYDDSSSSGSSGSYGTPTPTASDAPAYRIVRCAQPRKGKRKAVTSSLIELWATEQPGSQAYEIDVRFVDGLGNTMDTAETTVNLDGGEVRTFTLPMESPRKVSRVKECEVTVEVL
ncbi:hypothetical protein [Streptomyces anulatus]|uniref:hypothetical protein n=1 Tax=Streptomyces anulatus TaxID=1892 RepID=UPI001C2544C4|nr:hypothetical protein [Streptomyces anulatus]